MDNSMYNIEELWKIQQQNVDRARTMVGRKPVVRFSKNVLLSHYQRELEQSKNMENGFSLHNSWITLTYAPCTEPLSSLRRVSLTDLMLETVHRGKYVILKTLTEPDKSVGIRTVIEDPDGNVDVFSLYNYPLDKHYMDILPAGIIIALKEPYYKLATGGGAMLRCDHPQNIVYVDADDALVRQIIWQSGLPNSNCEDKNILSFDEYKLQGNNLFKQKKYYDAATIYTKALASASCESEIIILTLNRAAASLKLEHYEATLDDCRKILELNKENEKALYRAAKAFYGLGEYEQALVKMQLYAKCTSTKTEAENEVKRIKDRLREEQYGIYNWNEMKIETKESSIPRLDHASYVGPVRIVNTSDERGRGLVLTRDVRKGELLLCSKAFQVCYPSEAGVVVYFNTETKLYDKGAQGMLPQRVVNVLINNPSLAKRFFDLYAGKHRLDKISPIISIPPVIDAFWVGDICSMNAFALEDCDLNPREDPTSIFRYKKLGEDPSAIFLMPSYINHACLGNCQQSFIGDIMVIRALNDLPMGTELLMSYVDSLSNLDTRKQAMTKHGFVCICKLCQLEQAEPTEVRNRRKIAIETFYDQVCSKLKYEPTSNLVKRIEVAEEMINQIRQTYEESNRELYRIELCPPLFFLAKMYYSNRDIAKAIDTCMKVIKIHEFGTDRSIWTQCLFPAMTQLSLVYFETGEARMGQLWLEKLCSELSITATGNSSVFSEEYRSQFKTFGVDL